MMKKGNGLLSMLAVLILFVSVSAGAVSAAQADSEMSVEENTGDIGILATIHLGSMSTDGDGNTASVAGVGCVTAPAGQNTFTATRPGETLRLAPASAGGYQLAVDGSKGLPAVEGFFLARLFTQ